MIETLDGNYYTIDMIDPYAVLAAHLKLDIHRKEPLIFIDEDRRKWIKTKHGFSPAEAVAVKIKLLETERELAKTKVMAKRLESTLEKSQHDPNDIVGKKTKTRIKKILQSDVSDADKILQIKEYITKK